MQIFISWSGECSRQIGEAFRYWLPDVIQSIQPYFTPDDITKGQRWSVEVAEKLQSSQFGLFCITSENLTAPWLLFEAGAVSKDTKNGKVCPLLFGVESAQLSGPLLQFQATPYSREELLKFLKAINIESNNPLSDMQLERSFDRCWEELDEKIKKALSSRTLDAVPNLRSSQELTEEILGIVRTLSANQASVSENELGHHWLVLIQSSIEYMNDALKMSEGAEQVEVLELLKRMQSYGKLVFNLAWPKIKSTRAIPSHLAQVNEVMAQLSKRIEELQAIVDDNIPF